jgi:N utilization substance protein A
LSAAGVTTVEALADMTPEQLEAIEGIGPKTVEKISLAVNNYFASLEQGSAEVETGEAVAAGEVVEGEAAATEPTEAGAEDITVEIAVVGEEASSSEETAHASEAAAESQASGTDENEGQAESSDEPSEEKSASETRE